MEGTRKPPSRAQLDANSRNALLSTGPKTIKGKARSSRNALKHGLCAAKAVVPGESSEEFLEFRNHLWASLGPANPMEDVLVERIIHSFWGLRRAGRIFNGLLCRVGQDRRNRQFVNARDSSLDLDNELGSAFEAASGAAMDRVERHHVRLERSAMRSLQALEQLRASEFPLATDAPVQLGLFDEVDNPSSVVTDAQTTSVASIADLAYLPRVPGMR